MDVSGWGLGKLLKLPDWCFGDRWPIRLHVPVTSAGDYFDISENGLPEDCVIWEFSVDSWCHGLTGNCEFAFALGDQLPANENAFRLMEPVFAGMFNYGRVQSRIVGTPDSQWRWGNLKHGVHAAGRRLVGLFSITNAASDAGAMFVVSGVPREVPDWVVSGLAKVL